ncbi:MAG: DUF819 family protein [Bacteroidales bacterium]|nr:DUF819 family protein [Bacteroidales bacterium]
MGYLLLILFYFGLPALIVFWTQKSKTADKIGAVVFSYAIGLIIGNIGVIPETFADFQNSISEIVIAIAIPLVLFSSDLKNWFKLVGNTILSLILGLISVVALVYLGFYLFQDKIDEAWKISGLLVGVYSGGTPNLAALKSALQVNQDAYIITHTSDLIISAILLLFILSVGQKTFELILPKFSDKEQKKLDNFEDKISSFNDYSGFFKKENLLHSGFGLLLSLAIVGISVLISNLVKDLSSALVILSITTLGLAASFIKKIRTLKKTFSLGMYLIYVFCLIIASLADFSSFSDISSLHILLYVALVVIGSLILHTILSKIFKVDADTLIVTTIALVLSVPFIPVVASALKNKYIIISGIVVALIGYAIGNYLGIFVAYSLK